MIYCVEDDDNIRELVIYTLETTGLKARGFADGSAFTEALAFETPELILLDIMLPGEDGLEILKKLKCSSKTKSIPVIMVTAKGSEYDKVIGLDSGADDYVTKPFGMMELVSRIKAVLQATAESVADDTYKVARPFNIVTGDKLSDAAQDFINYIMSSDGQDIIEKEGYIKVDEKAEAYKAGDAKGKVVVMGSSSVGPVMEKLAEAYQKTNKNITVEVQVSDSTTGINSATEGVCDIGMASRELKDEETEKGVKATEIAKDGIAVIVNNDNDLEELSSDQVKSIFTGDITDWEDVTK